MKAPTRTEGDEDTRLNPADQDYQRRVSNLSAGEKKAFDSLTSPEHLAKDGVSGSLAGGVRRAENTPGWDYTGTGMTPEGRFLRFANLQKNKGPIGFIVSLIIGGLFLGSTLLAPGLGIVQLKEVMMGDLNDRLGALDSRTDAVLRAKLKSLESIGSACNLGIRCKFGSFSGTSVDRFKAAGFDIDCEGGCKSGRLNRNKITGMRFTDKAGTTHTIANPNDLSRLSATNSEVKSAVRKAFNPKTMAMRDRIANSVLRKNGTNREKPLKTGATPEEADNAVKSAVTGSETEAPDRLGVTEDEEGKPVVEDGNEQFPIDEAESSRVGTAAESIDRTAVNPGKAASHVATGAFKGIGVLGVTDSACTVMNTIRAISAGAKTIRAIQLAQYAMIFLKTADAIKTGDASPEEVEYIGNKLTATDTRERIYDEFSGVDYSAQLNGTGDMSSNPNYGKNAFDSAGYRIAAYNEAPTLTSQSMQFLVGGGLVGTLAGVYNTVKPLAQNCHVIQNVFVRGASLVAGAIMAIGTFGVGTAVSIGASVAISFALPFLEAMMSDLVAGKVVDETTASVDSGDAVFVGTSKILGDMASGSGMTPGTTETLSEYSVVQDRVANDYKQYETELAKSEPFNVMNQYSFMGSLARSLLPSTQYISNGPAGVMSSIFGVVSSGFGSLFNSSMAKAENAYNPDRFNKCTDVEYEELGIDADVFCNVRYVMTNDELTADPEDVIDYMVDNAYINDLTEEPQGKYAEWLNECTARSDGWGTSSEENGQDGHRCLDKFAGEYYSQTDLKNFRVFTMDYAISDAIDGDTEEGGDADSLIDTGNGSGTPGSVDAPAGSAQELAAQILATGKVRDATGQITRISKGQAPIPGYNKSVDSRILGVILGLAQRGYTFSVSSLLRNYVPKNGSTTSRHLVGKAADISGAYGINGERISYQGYSGSLQRFVNDASSMLPSNCQVGLPNSTYVNATKPVTKPGCSVFIDIGTGAHFHLGV